MMQCSQRFVVLIFGKGTLFYVRDEKRNYFSNISVNCEYF